MHLTTLHYIGGARVLCARTLDSALALAGSRERGGAERAQPGEALLDELRAALEAPRPHGGGGGGGARGGGGAGGTRGRAPSPLTFSSPWTTRDARNAVEEAAAAREAAAERREGAAAGPAPAPDLSAGRRALDARRENTRENNREKYHSSISFMCPPPRSTSSRRGPLLHTAVHFFIPKPATTVRSEHTVTPDAGRRPLSASVS